MSGVRILSSSAPVQVTSTPEDTRCFCPFGLRSTWALHHQGKVVSRHSAM